MIRGVKYLIKLLPRRAPASPPRMAQYDPQSLIANLHRLQRQSCETISEAFGVTLGKISNLL